MKRHYAEVLDGDAEAKQKASSPTEKLRFRIQMINEVTELVIEANNSV